MSEVYVTPAHLDAVRGEMHARIDQHRAEMSGELKALSSKLDSARSAQETDSIAMRGALDRLTSEVGKTTAAVDGLEGAAEIHVALASFKASMTRRLYLGLTLLVAALGVAVAIAH